MLRRRPTIKALSNLVDSKEYQRRIWEGLGHGCRIGGIPLGSEGAFSIYSVCFSILGSSLVGRPRLPI